MVFDRRRDERRHGERRQTERGTADRRKIDRRQLLKMGAIATVASLLEHPLIATASQMALPSREISLLNIHTGEKLSVEYCAAGEYDSEALQEINHILRDFRTGEIKPIEPRLLDHQRRGRLGAFQKIAGHFLEFVSTDFNPHAHAGLFRRRLWR